MIPVPPELLIEYFTEEATALGLKDSSRVKIWVMLLQEYELLTWQARKTMINLIHDEIHNLAAEAEQTTDKQLKLELLKTALKLQESLEGLTWVVTTA